MTKPQSSGKIIIVSGPSGVGKGTLLKEVLKRSDLPLVMSVSATTRQPRPGERDGIDYHFLSKEEFAIEREHNNFLECFEVFQGGDWYGTLKTEVDTGLAMGKWIVLEIDVRGGLAVKEIYPEAVMVFILPSNPEILKKRLKGRGTESDEIIAKRFDRAMKELDYQKYYPHRIVNDHLETAVGEFCELLSHYNDE